MAYGKMNPVVTLNARKWEIVRYASLRCYRAAFVMFVQFIVLGMLETDIEA